MLRSYRMASGLIAPLLPFWLFLRKRRGKEDSRRMTERFGYASLPRPPGQLLWLHAASVGEAMSVLLLVEKIRARWPHVHILLTTGTVTSARLMGKRLPQGVLHQYVPLDTPEATRRFIRHWHPQMAFWVESEFWPNLILVAHEYDCLMGIVNGRMSQRSFSSWQKFPKAIRQLLGCFDLVFAQSEEDAKRFRALGAKEVSCVGNLKYDAAILPSDEAQLVALNSAIGGRPHWLAASTHPGEEIMMAKTHALLSKTRPNLLTLIVPRHPARGAEIAAALASYGKVALRSRGDALQSATSFYVADTLGETGLFYRLNEIVFMGGSFVRHGGQNPLEPARLACAILTGPYTYNFESMYDEMERGKLCVRVQNPAQLAAQIDRLMRDPPALDAMQSRIKPWVESKSGAAQRLLEALEPVLAFGATP